jgi:uncharacterized protein (DUF983 family)
MNAEAPHAAMQPAEGGTMATLQAMRRGWQNRCPNCGQGRMFRAFLKVADACPACGEELHHHRADDFPAYVVILLVGHIVVPLVLMVETNFSPPYWLHMVLWPAAVLVLGLALLQPVKGAIVGMQWALGMHGFEQAKLARDALAGETASAGR